MDKTTAAKQGRVDPATRKPKGWAMPANAVYKAPERHAKARVVVSDVQETLPQAAGVAGVSMTEMYFDFVL